MNAYNYWHGVGNYLCVEFIIGVGIIIDYDVQRVKSLGVNVHYRKASI